MPIRASTLIETTGTAGDAGAVTALEVCDKSRSKPCT